jgi:hypothetical protein
MSFRILQDASAEQGWSDDNYAFHKTVFAPTTPQFIIDEQVCSKLVKAIVSALHLGITPTDTDVR